MRHFGMMPRIDSVRIPERSKQCGHAQTQAQAGRQAHTRTQSHSHASMHDEGSALERACALTPTSMPAHPHMCAHTEGLHAHAETQKRSEMRTDL